jgi:hypothetical protein
MSPEGGVSDRSGTLGTQPHLSQCVRQLRSLRHADRRPLLEWRLEVNPLIGQNPTRPADAVAGADPNRVAGVEDHEAGAEPCPIAGRPHDVDPTAGPRTRRLIDEPHEARIGRVAGDDCVEADASAC